MARGPLKVALWNPWIGGGRPGWLSGPEEGGAPLVLLAAVAARPGWAWTALLALELTVALLSTWWVLRLLGLGAWPAAVGATAYALSGAVTAHWLDWHGSALALGPLALAPALAPIRSRRSLVAAWTFVLLVLGASGAPAPTFVALAGAAMVFFPPAAARPARWLAIGAASLLVLALALPRIWLDRNGREPGAPASQPSAVPAISGWKAVVVATPEENAPAGRPGAAPAQGAHEGLAYVGLGTVALAVLGLLSAPARKRGFLLGVAGVSAVVISVPGSLLTRFGLWQRPYGVLALTAAALAAFGTQALVEKLPDGRGRTAVAASIWVLIALSLVPRAARLLPFISAEDTELATPIPKDMVTTRWRLVGLLGAMPPDAAASLGLADVRAASFSGEPRYASMLGAGKGGELSVSRALDPRIVRLGARWLLEPLPLRVVSGEVFSRIELADLTSTRPSLGSGSSRFQAEVPEGACRLGLPSTSGHSIRVRLESVGRVVELASDETLQAESTAWTWFEVPTGFPPGPAVVAISGGHGPTTDTLPAAWDTSGLRIARQQTGVRVWEWTTARPLAFLARGVEPEGVSFPKDLSVVTVPGTRVPGVSAPVQWRTGGSIRIASVLPDRTELRGDLTAPGFLVVQVKYRPRLFKATVNGSPVQTERVDGVWTGVPLPSGTSHVVLEAELPPLLWGSAAAALAVTVLLAAPRRLR
ncbi:MAG: YfhO family protein [Acidobacteriia bacterium]|nr:YfhO family protein [Terriglobia bacterium]